MADVSDLVPTLAAVAVTATTPTTISGVGFIRAKESDRLGDLADRAAGRSAPRSRSTADGLRIDPAGPLHGGELAPITTIAWRWRSVSLARGRARHRRRRSGRRVEELAGVLDGPRGRRAPVTTHGAAVPAPEPRLRGRRLRRRRHGDDARLRGARSCGASPAPAASPSASDARPPVSPRPWRAATATALKAQAAHAAFAGRPVADVEDVAAVTFAAYVAARRPASRRLDRLSWHPSRRATTSCSSRRRTASTCARSPPALGVDGVVATELTVGTDGRCTGAPRSAATAAAREGRPPARLARRAPRRS